MSESDIPVDGLTENIITDGQNAEARIFPVASLTPAIPLSTYAITSLVQFARHHEMAELFWVASDMRLDIPLPTLHDDWKGEIVKILRTRDDLNIAQKFLQSIYSTIEWFYANNHIPTPGPGQEVLLPCKIQSTTGPVHTYNIRSLVPGRTGIPAAYPIDHPKFRYYCSWCFNRHALKNKKLSTCSKCEKRRYCDKECQMADWITGHKRLCVASDPQ